MSYSNPIIALLANESLTGDNFVKWKSNVNIVLVCEKIDLFSLRNVLQNLQPMLLVVYENHMNVGFKPITKPRLIC